MTTIPARGARHQNTFPAVAEPFLQSEGLPFAEVLSAESIERVFREENALFAHDDIYSTDVVLWAFLAQALCDGKSAACASGLSPSQTTAHARPDRQNTAIQALAHHATRTIHLGHGPHPAS